LSARLSPVPPANGTCTTLVYRRRRRERAVLYRLVQQLLESWLAARREADPDGVPIPRHVERELRGYLAAVLIEAADRSGLERLLRYCACPAFASERLSWDGSDQPVRYCLTKPLPTGQTELALTPLELLDRLAALMPLPRGHCHHYAGLFVGVQGSDWNTDRVDEIRAQAYLADLLPGQPAHLSCPTHSYSDSLGTPRLVPHIGPRSASRVSSFTGSDPASSLLNFVFSASSAMSRLASIPFMSPCSILR